MALQKKGRQTQAVGASTSLASSSMAIILTTSSGRKVLPFVPTPAPVYFVTRLMVGTLAADCV